MLALVSSAKQQSLRRKATINWESLLPDVQDVLQQAGERWREAFVPLVAGVVEDAAEHWRVEAGIAFDVENLEAQAWFIDYMLQFSTPICDTSEREIAALLQQGQRDGWSVAEMQATLTDLFQQWVAGDVDAADFAGERLPPWRASAIARTETMRAYASGSMEIYRSAGVTEKEWLATQDDHTRDSHSEADGQVVGIDEPFNVGGVEMMQPGDPNAPPDETINCRCTVLPVVE